jgi:hypothetical protein
MKTRRCISCMLFLSLFGFFGTASAQESAVKKLSFGPFLIYLAPDTKPTIAFSTPCVLLEKLSGGFPLFALVRTGGFQLIKIANAIPFAPATLELVCV